MGAEFRWLFSSLEPIVTIRSKHSRWLMLSRTYRENGDVRAIALFAS